MIKFSENGLESDDNPLELTCDTINALITAFVNLQVDSKFNRQAYAGARALANITAMVGLALLEIPKDLYDHIAIQKMIAKRMSECEPKTDNRHSPKTEGKYDAILREILKDGEE